MENEIDEVKNLNEQLKMRNEQMALELKECSTDEQKFQTQVIKLIFFLINSSILDRTFKTRNQKYG